MFTILQIYRDMTFEKMVSGQLPMQLFVTLVSNAAFNGSRTHNLFKFQHYKLMDIAIYLDGQLQHVLKPIQPSLKDNLYIRAYNSLFLGTGKLNRDEGVDISRNDYKNG